MIKYEKIIGEVYEKVFNLCNIYVCDAGFCDE